MALHAKTNPIGIDVAISKIQSKLYSGLMALWFPSENTGTSKMLTAYPRCYVLEEGNKPTIEHFTAKKDYTGNLIVSEGNKFFFTAQDDLIRKDLIDYQTSISLYFILDVKGIYSTIAHRCDNEVLADVLDTLDRCPGLLRKRTVVTDFRKVFQGYQNDFKQNMQPYFSFRVDMTLSNYKVSGKC